MKKYLLLILLLTCILRVSAQVYLLSGRVTDKQTHKPVGFTSVYIKNSTYGTTANENGNYELKLSPGDYNIVYRFPGYQEITEKITISNQNVVHNAQMTDEIYQIRKFERTHGRAPDSAVDMIKKVMARRQYFLSQVRAYSCVEYIKGVQKLVKAPKSLMGQNVTAALNLDSSGKGILYQTESLSDYSFQQPDKVKEVVIAQRAAGQNTAFSYNRASDLAANFYKDIFTIPGLSSRGFVSPFAVNAFSLYDYYLVGSKSENGLVVHKIEVMPKHRFEQAFTGYVYVLDGDWRIYGIDLQLTSEANLLNLVDTLQISQQYVPIRDSVWEPLSVRYTFKGSVLGFGFEGYYLGLYNNYNLSPNYPDHFFDGERMHTDTVAKTRDSAWWDRQRPVPLTLQERSDYNRKDFMAEVQNSVNKYNAEKTRNNFNVIPYLVFGYKATYHNNKDSITTYPFIQTLYYNTVEGLGINLKGTYTHYFDDYRSFSVTPNARYGFADNLFNANMRVVYDYDPLKRGKFILGFGSDILDLSNVGTRSLYFNTLSTLLSEQNFVKYYRSEYGEFGYQHQITEDLVWQADLSYANRTQLYNTSFYSFRNYPYRHLTSNNPLMPDAPANDHSLLFPENQALTLSTSFTYTFDQQYDTRPTGRIYEPSPYPQIKLNYRRGFNGILGSDVNYDFASLELFHDHFAPDLLGYSSFKFVAGDFFNHARLYFMDYNHFLGNQGTTFDPTPGSFHFLPFYTYSTDGPFVEAHYEHNFSGCIFNHIPFLRRLKLDEIVGVNYLSTNQNRTYSEYYVGIQRFIFRIDYGFAYEGNKRYQQGFRIFYGIR
ncbi:MAG TPA: DUF5686 and carboxypeptidase regulatory-like domain-containing protein [Mucilaginibacter sp.]|nr:DUF5686 and carboxypeptidase regulatory-like domain-containing protein [Mucilaginibacter sp.]